MRFSSRSLCRVLALLMCVSATMARAQSYTSIVVFGDSLSDTGNDATVSKGLYGPSAQVPGPATGYTDGRFTDGTDTLPAAHNYFGVWLEQMAAMLPAKPAIKNSLAGGTNYAYGFATTNTGTSTFTYPPPNAALSFPVSNMGKQVSDYLATNPTINNKTLFIVWGGANDLIAATSAADIQNAAQRDAGIVQLLINAGATEFIVPNLPPLGLVPRFNGSATTSAPATQSAAGFNQYLAAYLAAIPAANPTKTLHLYQLDTYTLFNTIVAAPSAKGFTNVTASSSAAYTGVTNVNPDTYLFWDDLHPTTYGHYQLALAASTLIGTPVTTTTVVTSSNLNANLKASVTLTATVSDTSGVPMGTATFFDGSNVLGSSVVTGTGTSATATYTTTALAAGTHSITAMFAGANGYSNSTSAAINEVVTAPGLSSFFILPSLDIGHGATASTSLILRPIGGYTGTATVTCGTLPAHMSCSLSSSTVTLPGDNKDQTVAVSFNTQAAALTAPPLPGTSALGVLSCALFPCFGLLGFAAHRRKLGKKGIALLLLVVGLAGASTLGMTGCASAPDNSTPSGSYTIHFTVTANGTSNTTDLTVVVH